jgi:hypothetical protein
MWLRSGGTVHTSRIVRLPVDRVELSSTVEAGFQPPSPALPPGAAEKGPTEAQLPAQKHPLA